MIQIQVSKTIDADFAIGHFENEMTFCDSDNVVIFGFHVRFRRYNKFFRFFTLMVDNLTKSPMKRKSADENSANSATKYHKHL